MISVSKESRCLSEKLFLFHDKQIHKLFVESKWTLRMIQSIHQRFNLFNYRPIKQPNGFCGLFCDILMQLCKLVINFIMQVWREEFSVFPLGNLSTIRLNKFSLFSFE